MVVAGCRHGSLRPPGPAARRLWRLDLLADVDRLTAAICWSSAYRDSVQPAIVAHAEAACAARLYSQVLAHLRSLTLCEPLHERAHALYMIALAGSGRQAAASQRLLISRRRLDQQLGVRPCPELADAHQRVLRQQIPAASKAAAGAASSSSSSFQSVEDGSNAPQRAAPSQLPPAPSNFAGRSGELTMLTRAYGWGRALGWHGRDPRYRRRCWRWQDRTGASLGARGGRPVPDGQLYVNLRGFAPQRTPWPPVAAMRGFLDALHIPPERIPPGLDAGAALYRSLLADRRALIVLDDACDCDQVRPLLPGSPACLVLVTSRNRLTGLVAADVVHPLMLDVLGEHEARGSCWPVGSDPTALPPSRRRPATLSGCAGACRWRCP